MSYLYGGTVIASQVRPRFPTSSELTMPILQQFHFCECVLVPFRRFHFFSTLAHASLLLQWGTSPRRKQFICLQGLEAFIDEFVAFQEQVEVQEFAIFFLDRSAPVCASLTPAYSVAMFVFAFTTCVLHFLSCPKTKTDCKTILPSPQCVHGPLSPPLSPPIPHSHPPQQLAAAAYCVVKAIQNRASNIIFTEIIISLASTCEFYRRVAPSKY
jgi:hypothetical protein